MSSTGSPRRPVAYAAVVLDGQGDKGASTDSTGRFAIERVRPGIYRLAASCIGYRNTLTPEYVVSAATPFIEIELVEDAAQLDAVTVTPTPFRRTAESPVGLQVIGLREIEKSPAPTATFLASCAPIPAYRSRPSVTATT